MSALIPVDKNSKDEKQRYKMPTILTKTESGGNGVKTIFPNIEEVSRAIFREPEVLHKFFGYELGAQATYIAKENKYLVMGEFPTEIIQNKVFTFIEKFVLCSKCRCPETDVESGNKGKSVVLRCRACGTGNVAPVNEKMTPLLLKFAVKHSESNTTRMSQEDAVASSSAAAAFVGERREIIFPQEDSKQQLEEKQDKVLADVHAVLNNLTLPREQAAQMLVNIRKKAQVSEAEMPRLVIRGALRKAPADGLIHALRVASPQLQVLTARSDTDPTSNTSKDAHITILDEIAYLFLRASVKVAPFRVPMVLRMLVEEGVLEPQYIKEWHDNNTNPTRAKYYDKMTSRMIKYGFTTQDIADLTTGMAALKVWMGWEDDKVDPAEAAASGAVEVTDEGAEDKKEKKEKKDKSDKKEKKDKKDKSEKKSAKVEV